MKLTITIPSRRYYVDELVSDPANPTGILSSLADTFAQFNILKERAYNRLYDEKYLGIKLPEKLPAMIKKEAARRFGIRINDYYITSIYSRASGLLSSQKELQKLYDQEFKERQENREEKIKSLEEELARKQELKALFVARSKARKAGLVFADELFEPFKIRFRQDSVFFHGKKNRTVCLNAYLYECRVDREIRSLKQRIALIKDKIKRADSMYRSEPKRAVFGSRKQYREKDTVCRTSGQQEQWHKERTSRRFHSVHFSGRHTSQYGNFQCRYDVWAKKVEITLIDGKVLTLSNISFPYRGRELLELRLDPLHPSVGYSLEYRKDGNGREYFILKASFPVENDRMNYDMCSGVIAADLNYDHIAWAELNKDGCMTDCGVIGFSLEGLNSGEAGTVLGKACKELVRICSDRKKPLAKEKLDIKKTRLEYGNKKS